MIIFIPYTLLLVAFLFSPNILQSCKFDHPVCAWFYQFFSVTFLGRIWLLLAIFTIMKVTETAPKRYSENIVNMSDNKIDIAHTFTYKKPKIA